MIKTENLKLNSTNKKILDDYQYELKIVKNNTIFGGYLDDSYD